MTEDEIRLAAEALGVIPRSKTRPKSLEVPPGGLSQAQRQTQQTLSEGIKSAAERREAEESEAWGKKVEETTTPSEKILGGLEAAVALPSGAAMGILGQLGEGFKLLPQGGTNQFVAENTFLPRTEAGQRYFDVWAGGVEKAADWFGDTPLGEFLGDAFEKVPGIFPVSAATTKAVDDGLAGGVKGLKLAAEQARKQRQYETGQEGAFYRVRPVTEETGRALRGNKEEAGGGAETPGGSVRGDVPQPITDDALTEVMAQPDNFVRSVASDYAQQVNGRPYELPDMAPSSLLKQAPIGRVFDLAVSENPQYKKAVFEAYGRSMPEVIEQSGAKNYDQLVEAAYRQLAKETDDQFRRLPVNMSYHRAGEGNYSDSRDMLRDVYGNRHLYVFQGGDPHPFMSRVDPETGLNDNEKFRAVHDFFGHAIHGNQFGPKGEETAWLAHSQMYSPLARLAMSTETRGQNSVVNYTPLNAKLKARLSEIEGRIYEARRRGQTDDLKELQDIKKGLFNQFQFAPQYGLLLPPEMIRPDFAGKMPDYVRPLIQPAPGTATGARLFHYGKEPGIKVTDPSKYGTGIKGAEAIRLEGAPDIRPRTYFYTDPTKPPEAGLGPYRYTGEADLYDLEEDPLAFRALAAESLRSPFTAKVNPGMVDPSEAITATERLVKEYGYPGYMTPESGTAAVFQPVPVRRYAEGGAVNPFEVPTPENLALDPILAEEREMRRLKRAQEMAQRPLAEKAKGALEAAQTTASTVGRGVLRPFAELAGQAFGEKGMGERLVQSAPQPQTEVGKHYTGEVQDVMQEVGKFLEPAKIPQGPYMPELIPSLPYANRPQMLTQKLEEEFATPPIGAVQLQAQQAPRNPLGMYSQAEQVALNLPQQKGTGNQFLAQISKAPGVKPAELEWTGLADFLKSKGDQPVTKQEIQQHLDANRVQVEEVQLGDTLEARELDRWLDNWADKNPDTKTSDAIMRGLSFDEIAQVAKSENQPVVARLIGNQNNPAKYSQHQLPGGSNYREVLLTLPEKKSPSTGFDKSPDTLMFEQEMMDKYGSQSFSSVYAQLSLPELYKYDTLLRFDRNATPPPENLPRNFQSSHFEQPNILAHMRLNDRVDANGDKVLFVEEIQSDWGQLGKKEGFGERLKSGWRLSEQEPGFYLLFQDGYTTPKAHGNKEAVMSAANRLDAVMKGAPPAPFVQNTEDWVNLALKRLITDAVNNGYKKVAFINGSQSAARYDLSKQVDSIEVLFGTRDKRGKESGTEKFRQVNVALPSNQTLKFHVNDNGIVTWSNTVESNKGKSLDDIIGKEMAEKIMATEKPEAFSGVDLTVGGQGMKKFYDQIVPATANKLLKKLGGGKLEPVKIGDNEQLGFTITPEIVELVKNQGLPMFAAGGAVTMAKGGEAEQDNYALAEAEMQQEIEDALAYEKLNRIMRETEAKLREGLITPEEAVPLMGGLNAYEIARLYGLPTDDYVRPQLSSANPEQHYDLMLSPEKLSDMAKRHRDYDRRMRQHEYGPNSQEREVDLAKGGKVGKGMSGISAAREAMKAQRREERVQKNLEAYMGSTDKPQTYYHATQAPKDFRKFDLEKRPTPKSAAAVFLTPSTDWANEFDMADLKTLESATSAAPRIMPMITRAKNTFDYEDPGHVTQVMNQVELPPGIDRQHVADEIAGGNWNFIEDRNIQKAIKDLGFDSFNVKEKGVKNLGVFNPADVKALFNRGSYDPTTEDISKAAGGPVLKGIAKARAEAKMSTGGKAVKGADSALSGIAAARATQKAQRAKKDKDAPVYSEQVLQSTANRMAEQIQKDNPKMPADKVQEKAQKQAAKKLTWERKEKPELEKEFGELKRAPYSASLSTRQQNVPAVVQQRIEETERFLAQPTEPWQPPRKELQAFDRERIKDALEGFPGIEQTRFPRYQAPRSGALSMVQEIYQDPVNRRLIEGQIKRGLPLGGETFYASLYPLKLAALERGIPEEQFNKYIYSIAPASARNSIMNEMAVGQFLRNMHARGLPLDEKTVEKEMERFKNQYGTGLPLMPVHRLGVKSVLEEDIDLREHSKADIPTSYKIPTYGTQKAGDFAKSVVLDVHEAAGQTRGSRFHPYFTKQGGFSQTEYGPAEDQMLQIAQGLGIPGGMAQAGRWFGGGELTGLKSPRGDALDLLERQAAFTLHGQGINPTPRNIRNFVLDMIETGEGELMPYFKKTPMPDYRTEKKKGGLVAFER